MIRINQIKLSPNSTDWDLTIAIQKKLKRKSPDFTYTIEKLSVDGRNKPEIKYIFSVNVSIDGINEEQEKKIIKKINDNNVMYTKTVEYTFPKINPDILNKKIIIVGSGPAGLFCGLMLAKAGAKPIIIERGNSVDERCKKVEKFWQEGILDTECNVQFGEGGAGTFSDGKLNTQVKDDSGRIKESLKIFVEYGAPSEILYSNKPHIGTDILVDVVKSMRNAIIELGGEVHFNTKLTDIILNDNSESVKGIEVNNSDIIPCDILVLALGHSARDTFEMLYNTGLNMESKPFAIGLRVQHPQE